MSAADKWSGHACARCGLFLGSEFQVPSYHAKCKRLTASELDAVFDEAHGGRELLPIEQAIYEQEGAERFAKFHGHGRTFDRVTTYQPVKEPTP